ncbi:MAG TPA: 50S ribosomal protein L5 [Thermoplasmata archaeon]|nr:50S ribosomal protein L5 [Thermoplasmata archaeon]
MSAPPTAVAAPAGSPAGGNPYRAVRVIKVVVNAGVGESGEPRTKAEKVLQMVTRQKPIATRSHSTNRDFGIRQGQEIGAKVTLRGDAATEFLQRAFEARDRQFDIDSIDRNGNFSFGIADYTDFSGMKYDPAIGIHGMDIAVEMGRAGHRIRNRRLQARPLPKSLRSSRDETRAFLVNSLGVTILE